LTIGPYPINVTPMTDDDDPLAGAAAPIPDDQMGDVWPAAWPGPEGADYGQVDFAPLGRFQVRSFQTFTLTYTVGEYGLDDTGAIKVVQRWTSDQGAVQFDDPAAMNYVTASASNGVHLALHNERYPHRRPWYNGLRVTVEKGFMRPGDTITIVFGDRSGGSPGYRLQTFCESAFEFKVLADPCATGVFVPVAAPHIAIVAAAPTQWHLVAPTLRRPDERFALGIRAEDAWGNATAPGDAPLTISANAPVDGLPATVTPEPDARGTRIDGLSVAAEGQVVFELGRASGEGLAVSNTLVVREGSEAAFWGDLHGQSGETVGINPMREYLEFARDVAFLDVTSHQANDFQITKPFWAEINALSAEFNQDGAFTVFPGYEWSGNTPVGGDHNVFFRHEGETIHRSSHALLTDRSDIGDDAPTLRHLFDKLKGRDAVLYGHVGGRPADISFAHDAGLRTTVEVHSDWGTFEWIMTDAFELGYRVGLVCNSDGHKGAPGACYPGASEFGAYSGLTCFLAPDLNRDAIFDAMRKRRHYGTTGCRMHLEVKAELGSGGKVYSADPAYDPTAVAQNAGVARMGDIARTPASEVVLRVTCNAHAPIERIDILRGAEVIETLRPYNVTDLGARIRVVWQGAEYRGRGRQTFWNGHVRIDGPEIARHAAFNAWNLERHIGCVDARTLRFDAVTTGNFGGVDLWLDGPAEGRIAVETDIASGAFDLGRIGLQDTVIDAGGLDRKLRLFRLPEKLETRQIEAEVPVARYEGRDTQLWVRVTTQDGFNAWSSPIYLIP
jgi:hypothetical protein